MFSTHRSLVLCSRPVLLRLAANRNLTTHEVSKIRAHQRERRVDVIRRGENIFNVRSDGIDADFQCSWYHGHLRRYVPFQRSAPTPGFRLHQR